MYDRLQRDNAKAVFVLNDQGGAQMEVSRNKTSTLRAESHGHPPIVFLEKAKQNETEGMDYDIRRLTPNECARLQGFPADWCSGVPHSDSAEYKLWGNGIALPSILPMMQNAVNLIEDFKKERGIE